MSVGFRPPTEGKTEQTFMRCPVIFRAFEKTMVSCDQLGMECKEFY
jgi:hypothetical protein